MLLFPAAISCVLALAPPPPMRLTVVDSATGRGVPMVELTTVNGLTFITDSAGVAAFDEPGLMGQDVFFTIKSHGYTFPKDGFGFPGASIHTAHGASHTFTINRVNIAQRLYRVTGAGLYRDSLLLGDTPPIRQPLLNAQVTGQDSVQTILYRGALHWFWGDTNRASYPLGNFSTSGATSLLPSQGGLDPSVGVDLTYFTDPAGFSRPMCPIPGQPGPVWIDGLVTLPGPGGAEQLFCHFVRVKTLGELYEQGLAQYNDAADVFEPITRFPTDAPLYPQGHPLRHADADGDFWYFPAPFPLMRCRATRDSLLDLSTYESYTCLKPGTRFRGADSQLDRDAAGSLVYAWKPATPPISQKEQSQLLAAGLMKPREPLLTLHDAASGAPVLAHVSSVCWNQFRQRWIMIFQELGGASMCGEIWYAQAPALTGPWGPAVKIITHDDYSFYNVMQHPSFDQDNGRVIYLEATYTMAFSGAKTPTPRYDYNQVMYRLELDDPRLAPAQ